MYRHTHTLCKQDQFLETRHATYGRPAGPAPYSKSQQYYVYAINTWHLMKHQALDYLQNLLEYDGSLDAYLKF